MSFYQNCPGCGTHIEKTEGCPHMICKCTREFCYKCGKDWKGYNHDQCIQNLQTISQLSTDPISNQIKIYVQFNSQNEGFLVHQTESVESLKDLVRQHYSIDPNNQKLIYSNRQLENGNTIQDYSIQNGATVYLVVHNNSQASSYSVPKVQIFVEGLDRRQYTIDVSLKDRVESLKNQISNKTGVPVDQQRLIYGGKQLENGNTLDDYGIQRDSTIHLVLRLRGGL